MAEINENKIISSVQEKIKKSIDEDIEYYRNKANQLQRMKDSGVSIELRDFSTRDLVEELRTREGVEVKDVQWMESETVSVNGPCIVITVID